jgi:hypothetical protein
MSWKIQLFVFAFLLVEARLTWGINVCMVNVAGNMQSNSLFTRGLLPLYKPKQNYSFARHGEQYCAEGSFRVYNIDNKPPQLYQNCLGKSPCVAVGDERCKLPGSDIEVILRWIKKHQPTIDMVEPYLNDPGIRDNLSLAIATRVKRNVILREYYSTKYDIPSFSLGARNDFKLVEPEDRDRGNRKYMFNFIGSVQGAEADRKHMQEVINNTEWRISFKVDYFKKFVRSPDVERRETYRSTLLDSSFTLAPVGNGDESHRFWEAIEAGSIPIFVPRMSSKNPFQPWCPGGMEEVLNAIPPPPIIVLKDWSKLPIFISHVTEKDISQHRQHLRKWAQNWWEDQVRKIDTAIDEAYQRYVDVEK